MLVLCPTQQLPHTISMISDTPSGLPANRSVLDALAGKMNLPRPPMPDEMPEITVTAVPAEAAGPEAVATEEEEGLPVAAATVLSQEGDAPALPLPIDQPPRVIGDVLSPDGTGEDGDEPKAKRLKRKQMAAMSDEDLSRRTWCLKCKADGKSRWSWKGSRTDARNGLRHHMKMAHQLTMEQAKEKGWCDL